MMLQTTQHSLACCIQALGRLLSPVREVGRDLTSVSHMRMFHMLLHWHVIPSSGRPTPQITMCPVFYRVASEKYGFFPLKSTLSPLLSNASHTYLLMARSPPQTPGKDAERGTALRHWDAVSRQSRITTIPSTQNTRQSRKQIVYLCLLTFSRINRNPDSCHWTADVEKSRE